MDDTSEQIAEEELLDAGSTDDLVETSAEPTPTPPRSSALPDDLVGPYRILFELGHGGMGTVYLAEQSEPVKRRVALKVIRRTRISSHRRQRFDAERQALARLGHPNVAQLYDAGTTSDGVPYFAMEPIEGEEIIAYSDRARLDLAARIELFRQVCDGVGHAHQKGVLHRDLKPSNILVAEIDGRAVPKVIDFGIAKALDQPLVDAPTLTTDRFVGTPAYLSPEAIDDPSGIDTRSDVYSLGVVLYELLVGARPHGKKGDTTVRLLRLASEKDAPAPSVRWLGLEASERERAATRRDLAEGSMVRSLRGDLDHIVQKALAREPDRRYASPGELAADLGRFLRREPIEARPPTLRYRLSRLAQRHRFAVAAASLAVVALLLGTVGATIGLLRARDAEAQARIEADRARREAETAARVSDFLVGLFQEADPTKGGGDATLEVAELLDRGRAQLRGGLEEEPAIQARLASALGDIYRAVGDYDRAREQLELALALWEEDPAADPIRLAQTLNHLAVLDRNLGEFSAAESGLVRALSIWERELGPESPRVAGLLNNLGTVYIGMGRLDEAAEVLARSLAIWTRELGPDHRDVGIATLNLGNVLNQLGRDEEAVAHYRRSAEIFETLLGPDHPHVATALGNVGDALTDLGELEDAEIVIREALRIRRAALGPEHSSTARAAVALGKILVRQGRVDEADVLVTDAVARLESSLGGESPYVAYAATTLAEIRRAQGREAEALELVDLALEILLEHVPDDEVNIESARKLRGELLGSW